MMSNWLHISQLIAQQIIFITFFALAYRAIAKLLGKGNKQIYYDITCTIGASALSICVIYLCCPQLSNPIELLAKYISWYRFLYLIFSTPTRKRILAFWGLLSVLGVLCFDGIKLALKLRVISSRKLFHFLVVVLFIPGIYFDVISYPGQPITDSTSLYSICICVIGVYTDEVLR